MNTLRVLHVIHSVAPNTGGPAAALGSFIDALEVAGVRSEVLTTSGSGMGMHEWCERVPVTVVEAYGPKRVGFAPGIVKELLRHAPRFEAIEVHGMWIFHSLVTAGIAKLTKTPLIVRPCGSFTRKAVARAARMKALYYWALESHVVDAASLFHFTTAWELEESAGLTRGVPGVVVPVPVAGRTLTAKMIARAQLGIPREDRVVLSVGRIHDIKRLDRLVTLIGELPGVRLALVGPEDGAGKQLRHLARTLKVSDRVIFAGLADRESVGQWMAASDLFVSSSAHENFGLAIAEACAAGMPCVIPSALPIARELGEGVVSVGEELRETVAACSALLGNQQHAQELGRRGRQRAASLWSKEAIGTSLRAAYESVLRPPGWRGPSH